MRSAIMLIAASVLCSPFASAQNFNIDFGPTGQGTPLDTYGAAANAPGFWNAVGTTAGTDYPLRDRSGALTTVTITPSGGHSPFNACPGAVKDPNWQSLMCDASVEAQISNTARYSLFDLEPGTYLIYIYAANPFESSFRYNIELSSTLGHDSIRQIAGPIETSTFVRNRTHAVMAVDVPPFGSSGGVLSVSVEGVSGTQDPRINGLQLTKMRIDCEGDLNGDNACDLNDLQLLLFYFGQTCP